MSARDYHWQKPSSGYKRANDSRFGYYVCLALLVSLVVHSILWFFFEHKKINRAERLVLTEKFRLEQRGTYDPKVLQALEKSSVQKAQERKKAASEKSAQKGTTESDQDQAKALAAANMPRPEDFATLIQNKEIRATPGIDEVENAALPALDVTDLGELDSQANDEAANRLLQSLQAASRSEDPDHPALPVDSDETEGVGANPTDLKGLGTGVDAVPEGFASLDQVLGMKGRGDPGKPIWVPTDTLFDFNSAELREEAKLSLMKLGGIIMQRRDCDFILEGHTDLIGSDDYNDELSYNRALAIRNWLVESLQLDPNRIKAQGLGKRHPRVLEGDADAQQINRRVEVVIRPHQEAEER